MSNSPILSYYIARNFFINFLIIFFSLMFIIYLIETIELLRRGASEEGVTLGLILEMGLFKLPFMAQQTFPFAVLFGGMVAFWRLTRSRELVVARAAGVSAWQFLFPVLLLSFALGIFKIMAFNPLASALLAKYDRLNATHLKGQTSLLAISKTGLWLRQASGKKRAVVHAKKVSLAGKTLELRTVSIFIFSEKETYNGRITARTAQLEDGFWHLRDAFIHKPENPVAKFAKEDWFETDLTLNNIQDSFASPESMSFWDLPGFISNLDRAGFSALRHRLYWHTLLAAPLLLCSMVLIAATFTLRPSQRGGTAFIVIGGILTGFVLFFFSDLMFALGLRDTIPVVLAAWTPSGVCALLGLAMVFHLEDG